MRKLIFLLLVFPNFFFAKGGISFDETDRQIINSTYNFDFTKAELLLKTKLQQEPQNLKYYFLTLGLKSMIIEKRVFDEQPAKKRELKQRLIEESINYANGVIVKFEDVEQNTVNKFYLGCVYGYLGRLHGVARSWMSAFSDGKTGRNLLQEVIEESPDFYDAYLLLGMFNYYGDRMGGFLGFVAGVLGFSGDREVGIEYILKTYNKGELLADQAEMLLIELYSTLEGNKFSAIPLHRKFVKRYPNNDHMLNWYVRDLLYLDMYDEVKKVLDEDKQKRISPYLYAQYYNSLGNYEGSNRILEKELKNTKDYYDGQVEHMKFLRVENLWMLDKRKEVSDFTAALNDEYKAIFKELNSDEKNVKMIMNFGTAANTNNLSKEQRAYLSNPPKFSNKFHEVLFALNTGVYKYQNKNYSGAAKDFEKVMYFDKEYFHYKAAQYLIDIYGRIEAKKYKVELLVEEIDDKDYENLSFAVEDVKLKYKL